jgi:hypothetical protein
MLWPTTERINIPQNAYHAPKFVAAAQHQQFRQIRVQARIRVSSRAS